MLIFAAFVTIVSMLLGSSIQTKILKSRRLVFLKLSGFYFAITLLPFFAVMILAYILNSFGRILAELVGGIFFVYFFSLPYIALLNLLWMIVQYVTNRKDVSNES
ncbi:hypothetical protein [Aquibacillus kalidii]|uniref:hypothetical protein n=1 Tax=Aquibacillus kalidii TaxID=2762597 RepID=UPI0016488792|nr:hypothetical protein [Aquibacillus kalidii]